MSDISISWETCLLAVVMGSLLPCDCGPCLYCCSIKRIVCLQLLLCCYQWLSPLFRCRLSLLLLHTEALRDGSLQCHAPALPPVQRQQHQEHIVHIQHSLALGQRPEMLHNWQPNRHGAAALCELQARTLLHCAVNKTANDVHLQATQQAAEAPRDPLR
jgi:hypothetical protein